MSLVAWWPLHDGTVDNLVDRSNPLLFNHSSYNTWQNAGKIGKTLQVSNQQYGSVVSAKTLDLGRYQSMFCWLYLPEVANYSSDAKLHGICGQHRYQAPNGFGLAIRYVSSSSGYLSLCSASSQQGFLSGVNATNGKYRTYTKIHGTTLLQAGRWYHVGLVFNNGRISLYVDGQREELANSGTALNTQEYSDNHFKYACVDADYFGIFMWSFDAKAIASSRATYAGYAGPTRLNDVRVYNHALSKKEIKELSKALVLHYTFNDTLAEPTTNLLPLNLQNKYVENVADAASYTITSGLTASAYTLSANIKRHIGDQSPSPYVSLNVTYSDGTSESITTTTAVDGYNIRGTADDQFHHYRLTIFNTSKKTVTKVNGWILDRGGYTSGTPRYMTVQNAQLEAKDHATPYTSNSRGGVMTNAAGYDNTLTCVGSPSFVSNSPIRDRSIDFNGSGYYKNDSFSLTTTEYTVSFWFKMPSTTTSQHFLWGLFNSWSKDGTGMYRNQNAGSYNILVKGSSASYLEKTYTFTTNTWNHVVMTYTGAQTRVYINGGAATVYNYSGGEVVLSKIYLGNSKYSGAPTSEIDEAQMSDFRVYATAIDKDMDTSTKISSTVQEMYKSRWAANKNAQVFSYCVNENQSKFQITRNGVNSCNTLSEFSEVYELIDYVEAASNRVIDTEADFNPEYDSVELQYSANVAGGAYFVAGCGATTNGIFDKPYMWLYHYNTVINAYVQPTSGSRADYASGRSTDTNKHILKYTNKTFYCDEYSAGQSSYNLNENFGHFYLFNNTKKHMNYATNGKIYYCKIWKSGQLVRDLIPVKRIRDGATGFLDGVTKKFYTDGSTSTSERLAVNKSNSLLCSEFNEI